MIVTVTMNPAVDKSTSVDKLISEKKLRCETCLEEAGGGGINVSKAVQKLGGQSLAVFPSGGVNGEVLKQKLVELAIPFRTLTINGQTRENFSVTERATNAQYRFVMPGSPLQRGETDSILSLLSGLHPAPSILIASGSLPPGVPDDFYARLSAAFKKTGTRCIIDTSGVPLKHAAREGVYLLKPNLSELCSLADRDYLELHEVDEAAREVVKKGQCEVMVVSMGPAGALLISKDIHERIPAPTVKKRSSIGAGDSMVGGMAWMLEQGKSTREAVQFGVACGTAAIMNAGTQLFRKEDAFRLYDWIQHH